MTSIMNAVSKLFRDIGKSCYDLEYYRQVRSEPVRKSVAYLSRFYGMLGLMGAIMFVPGLFAAHIAFTEHLASRLPDGTRFALEKGVFATNLEMPFDIGATDAPIVIDTSLKGLEVPSGAKSEVLMLGADAAFFPDNRSGKTTVLPYADIPAFSFTKDAILTWLDGIGGPVIMGLGLGLVLLWVSGVFVGGVLYVLLMAWFAMMAARISKVPISYRQWVATGLHVMTLPVLLSIGFGATLGRIPFLTTIIFAMFAYSIIMDERSNPSLAPSEAPAGPPSPNASESSEGPNAGDKNDESDSEDSKEDGEKK